MRITMTLIYLLIAILGVSFSVLNAQSVAINLYVKTIDLPVALLVLMTFVIGLFFGFILFLLRHWRLQRESRKISHK